MCRRQGPSPCRAGTPNLAVGCERYVSRPVTRASEASVIETVAMMIDMRVRPRREVRMAPGSMAASEAARIDGTSVHWGWTSS